MKPRSAKNKGKRLQNAIAAVMRTMIPEYWPGTPDQHVKSTTMGESGQDIQLSPHAAEILPFAVECKNQETWSVPSWWAQAKKNAGRLIPVLVLGRNRQQPLVVVEAAVYFEMWKRLHDMARSLREYGGHREDQLQYVSEQIRKASGQSLRIQFGTGDDMGADEAVPGAGDGPDPVGSGDRSA